MAKIRRGKNGHTAPEDEPRLPVPLPKPPSSAPPRRTGTSQRRTKETDVRVTVDLDGSGRSQIDTGLRFFDHLLEAFAHHSLIDLEVFARGDLEVDPHHTVEDVGICLGRALTDALGSKLGIYRYGECTRCFDEALVKAYVDFCGRPVFVYKVDVAPGRIGTFDVELAEVFYSALAAEAKMNLHLVLEYGKNRHHIVEGSMKALAFAIRSATELDVRRALTVPSTKGVLD